MGQTKNMRLVPNSAVLSASVLQCETIFSNRAGFQTALQEKARDFWCGFAFGVLDFMEHGSLVPSTANEVCCIHVLRGDGDVSRSGLWAPTALAACPSRCTRCVVTGVNDGMGEVLVEGQWTKLDSRAVHSAVSKEHISGRRRGRAVRCAKHVVRSGTLLEFHRPHSPATERDSVVQLQGPWRHVGMRIPLIPTRDHVPAHVCLEHQWSAPPPPSFPPSLPPSSSHHHLHRRLDSRGQPHGRSRRQLLSEAAKGATSPLVASP